MAEVNDLNITDASNTARFPENMAPSAVNNGARALEGMIARWHKDTNGSLVSTGSSNAYVVAANQTLSAYYAGLVIAFRANFTNTGAATLNVDSLGADNIVMPNGQSLSGGEIRSTFRYWLVHNGSATWMLVNPALGSNVVIYDDDAGSGSGPTLNLERDSASPAVDDNLGRVRFIGDDAGGAVTEYATVNAAITDPTAGSEDGRLRLSTIQAGSTGTRIVIANGLYTPNATGGDQGADTLNVGAYYTNGAFAFRNHIDGLTLSNNATDSDHDIDIAAGIAADDGNAVMLSLSSTLTKRLDAAWTVGSGNGGLDTGTVTASTWYHVWIIRRSDTGVVDALFSNSATSPTMPTNYDQKRRIGAVRTDGSSNILGFFQIGDHFTWDTPINDVNATSTGTAAVTRTLTAPTGVEVLARVAVQLRDSSTSTSHALLVTSLDSTDTAPGSTLFTCYVENNGGIASTDSASVLVKTNTSGQIRSRNGASQGDISARLTTLGWIDLRGRDS